MSPEIERFREIGGLIRAGHAELRIFPPHLMDAYERRFNPAQLGVRIADLSREIAAWKRKQKALFRHIASDGASETESSLGCMFTLDRLNAQKGQTGRVKRTEKRNSSAIRFSIRKQVVV
ncbi:MAG TPA: hypothetical protein VLU73_02960 [Methylococcaceae bacterium]|nr:hypothetical protein [Methylococcaceae bacterium]